MVKRTYSEEVSNFNPDLKFTDESNEKEIPVLDLKVKLNEGKISTDLNLRTDINIYILHHQTLIILKGQ